MSTITGIHGLGCRPTSPRSPKCPGTESASHSLTDSANESSSLVSVSSLGFKKNEAETSKTPHIEIPFSKLFSADNKEFGSIIPQFLDTASLIAYLNSNKNLHNYTYRNNKQAEIIVNEFKEKFVKTPLGKLMLKTVPVNALVSESESQRLLQSPLFKPLESYLLSKKEEPILKLISIPVLNILNPVLNPYTPSSKKNFLQRILLGSAFLINGYSITALFVNLLKYSTLVPQSLVIAPFCSLAVFVVFIISFSITLIYIHNVYAEISNQGPIVNLSQSGLFEMGEVVEAKAMVSFLTFVIMIIGSIFIPIGWIATILYGIIFILDYADARSFGKEEERLKKLISDNSFPILQSYTEFYDFHRQLFPQDQILLYKQIEEFKKFLIAKNKINESLEPSE